MKGVGADSRGGDAHLCALGTASVDRCCGPDEIYVNALEFQRLVLTWFNETRGLKIMY